MSEDRYPIGEFEPKGEPLTSDERAALAERVTALPSDLDAAVEGLDEEQLDTPYRVGGWSPRQIVHHLADSHMNAFVRFKLGLTEERPTIKPYDQDAWTMLSDVERVPVAASLGIVHGLHARWARLLEGMADADFRRKLVHPEIGEIDLDYLLQMYAWHGHHHTTQIRELRTRMGWS